MKIYIKIFLAIILEVLTNAIIYRKHQMLGNTKTEE